MNWLLHLESFYNLFSPPVLVCDLLVFVAVFSSILSDLYLIFPNPSVKRSENGAKKQQEEKKRYCTKVMCCSISALACIYAKCVTPLHKNVAKMDALKAIGNALFGKWFGKSCGSHFPSIPIALGDIEGRHVRA